MRSGKGEKGHEIESILEAAPWRAGMAPVVGLALRGERGEDADLGQLAGEYQTTGAKLAGALDSPAYERDLNDGPFIAPCLKRTLNHLHTAQAALAKVAPKNLLPAGTIAALRAEFFALREEILRLMAEFRGQQ